MSLLQYWKQTVWRQQGLSKRYDALFSFLMGDSLGVNQEKKSKLMAQIIFELPCT